MSARRQYELVYIVAAEATDEQVSDLHAQIEALVKRFEAELVKTENWGRRKLAYPIRRHKEGTYVLEVINGTGDLIKEIDRRLRVTEQVIRHLVVRVDEELKAAERARSRRKTPVSAARPAEVQPDAGGEEEAAEEAEG